MAVTKTKPNPRVCPRCDICSRAIRTFGLGLKGEWCKTCLGENLPFTNILSDRDYKDALREFREGIGSGGVEFEGARFDPFGESEREILKSLDKALRGCEYCKTKDLAAQQKKLAKEHGCSMSVLFHNIRSAKGPGLELLEGEIRQSGVEWDVIGLAETWLDDSSEKIMKMTGFTSICASRERKSGGG